jgi:hypothetical protein
MQGHLELLMCMAHTARSRTAGTAASRAATTATAAALATAATAATAASRISYDHPMSRKTLWVSFRSLIVQYGDASLWW